MFRLFLFLHMSDPNTTPDYFSMATEPEAPETPDYYSEATKADGAWDVFKTSAKAAYQDIVGNFQYGIGDALSDIPGMKLTALDAFSKSKDRSDRSGDIRSTMDQEQMESWPSMIGSAAVSFVPTVAGIGVSAMGAPQVGAPLAQVGFAGLAGSTYGGALKEYDEYKRAKGEEQNPMERYAVALANAGIEYATERLGVAGDLIKKVGRAGKPIIKTSVKESLDTGKEILAKYAKSNPEKYKQLAKTIATAAGSEGASEALAELSQGAITNWYKDVADRQDFVDMLDGAWKAGVIGAGLGAGVGPVSYNAQNQADRKRREDQGVVRLAKLGEESVEIVQRKEGKEGKDALITVMFPDGYTKEVKESEIGETVDLNTNQFYNILKGKVDENTAIEQSRIESDKQKRDAINQQIDQEFGQFAKMDQEGNPYVTTAKYNNTPVFIVDQSPSDPNTVFIVDRKAGGSKPQMIDRSKLQEIDDIPLDDLRAGILGDLTNVPEEAGQVPTVGEVITIEDGVEGKIIAYDPRNGEASIEIGKVDEDGKDLRDVVTRTRNQIEQYRTPREVKSPEAVSVEAERIDTTYDDQGNPVQPLQGMDNTGGLAENPQETTEFELEEGPVPAIRSASGEFEVQKGNLTNKQAQKLANEINETYPNAEAVVENRTAPGVGSKADFRVIIKERPQVDDSNKSLQPEGDQGGNNKAPAKKGQSKNSVQSKIEENESGEQIRKSTDATRERGNRNAGVPGQDAGVEVGNGPAEAQRAPDDQLSGRDDKEGQQDKPKAQKPGKEQPTEEQGESKQEAASKEGVREKLQEENTNGSEARSDSESKGTRGSGKINQANPMDGQKPSTERPVNETNNNQPSTRTQANKRGKVDDKPKSKAASDDRSTAPDDAGSVEARTKIKSIRDRYDKFKSKNKAHFKKDGGLRANAPAKVKEGFDKINDDFINAQRELYSENRVVSDLPFASRALTIGVLKGHIKNQSDYDYLVELLKKDYDDGVYGNPGSALAETNIEVEIEEINRSVPKGFQTITPESVHSGNTSTSTPDDAPEITFEFAGAQRKGKVIGKEPDGRILVESSDKWAKGETYKLRPDQITSDTRFQIIQDAVRKSVDQIPHISGTDETNVASKYLRPFVAENKKRIEKEIDKVLKKWKAVNREDIVVWESILDFQFAYPDQPISDPYKVSGLYHDGKVHVIASHPKFSKGRVLDTLIHEGAGHYGLRRMFGINFTKEQLAEINNLPQDEFEKYEARFNEFNQFIDSLYDKYVDDPRFISIAQNYYPSQYREVINRNLPEEVKTEQQYIDWMKENESKINEEFIENLEKRQEREITEEIIAHEVEKDVDEFRDKSLLEKLVEYLRKAWNSFTGTNLDLTNDEIRQIIAASKRMLRVGETFIPKIELRPVPGVSDFHVDTTRFQKTPQVSSFKRGDNLYVSAEVNGDIVATAMFAPDGEVMAVDVDEDFRRQGIATEMYKHAKSKGIDVKPGSIQTNDAKKFWEGARFQRDYGRVIPRDFFNESKLITMYSRFADFYNQGKLPEGFEIVRNDDEFGAGLNDEGTMYSSGVEIYYNGDPVSITMTYNAGKNNRFPLMATLESEDIWSVTVFDENGELDSEFIEAFGESSGEEHDSDVADMFTDQANFLKQMGVVGLWHVDGMLPQGFEFDVRDFDAESFGLSESDFGLQANNVYAEYEGEPVDFYLPYDKEELYFNYKDETGPVIEGSRDMSDEFREALGIEEPRFQKSPPTDSPAFKKWFGDSKVVDENGYPLVVYHGTREDFDEFDIETIGDTFAADERGFFFTDNPKWASDYAKSTSYGMPADGGSVIPAYLSIKSPLIIDKAWLKKEGMDGTFEKEDPISFWDVYQDFALEEADKINADGIIVDDGDNKLIVAFEPTQIKSATGNRGTFDPNNPDIRFQIVGEKGAENDPVLKRALSDAKKLENEGLLPDDIYLTTGWEKGADDQWKYDLNDNNAEIVLPVDKFNEAYREVGDNLTIPLGQVLKYDELYNLYPDLEQMPVVFTSLLPKGVLASYGSKGDKDYIKVAREAVTDQQDGQERVGGGRLPELQRRIIHEIQHSIQNRERGFARGANFLAAKNKARKELFGDKNNLSSQEEETVYELAKSRYLNAMGEVEARNVETRALFPEKVRKVLPISSTEDVSRSGQARFQRSDYNPADNFYSNSLKAVANINQGKATADQWKSMLLKNGASQAELDWIGFDDFLKGKPKATKEEVYNFLEQNKIEVTEVVKGESALEEEIQEYLNGYYVADSNGYGWLTPDLNDPDRYFLINEMGNEDFTDWPVGVDQIVEDVLSVPDEVGGYAEITVRYQPNSLLASPVQKSDIEQELSQKLNIDSDGSETTKYSQYVLPGGKNYKELLLTMPHKPSNEDYLGNKIIKDEDGWFTYVDKDGEELFTEQKRGDLIQRIKEYLEVDEYLDPEGNSISTKTQYKSSHWDEPNVLAHIRFNERFVDGNKTLFIEEIQSDWQAEGRKRGFKGDGVSEDAKNDPELAEADEFYKVPNMPFKTTAQYINLAMRRMIRYASENGFDRIAWVTGEQSAERYDLSKQVDEIAASAPTKEGARKVELITKDHGELIVLVDKTGKVVSGFADTEGKHLSDVIGKDLADKVLSTNKELTLEGENLKVGGSGMISFYNKILPAQISKILKKHDKMAKVEEVEINNRESRMVKDGDISFDGGQLVYKHMNGELTNKEFVSEMDKIGYEVELNERGNPVRILTKQSSFQQLSFPITPVLRQRSIKEGMPLFQRVDTLQESPTTFTKKRDKWVATWQDRFVYLRKLQEMKYGDKRIADELNAYDKENLSKGIILEQIRVFKKNLWTPLDETLNAINKEGLSVNEASRYLKAKHIVEDEIEAGGIPMEEAKILVKEFEEKLNKGNGKLNLADRLQNDIRKINQFILDKRLESGLISKEAHDDLMKMYKFYVPLRGFNEAESDPTIFTRDYKRKGRTSESGDPMAYLGAMAQTAIAKGEQNKVLQALHRFIVENPDSRFYKIKTAYYVKDKETGELIDVVYNRPTKDEFEKYDISMTDPSIGDEKAYDLYRQKTAFERENITVKIGGKSVTIEFIGEDGQRIAQAIKNQSLDNTPKWLSWMGQYTRLLRQMYTQYSPEFALRNFIRDTFTGLINMRTDWGTATGLKVSGNIPKSMYEVFKWVKSGEYDTSTKNGRYLKEYVENGAITGYSDLKDIDAFRKELEDSAKEVSGFKKLLKKGKNIENTVPLRFIDNANRMFENTTRFAAFKTLRDQGVSPQQAAMYAKDLTVNFNRKGNVSDSIGTLFLFFNASVQGVERLTRPFISGTRAQKTRAYTQALLVLPAVHVMLSLINKMWWDKDEDGEYYYDKLPEYIKTHNLTIPNFFSDKPGTFLHIPLPYGFNVLFTWPEHVMGVVEGRTSAIEALVKTGTAVTESFSPLGAPNFDGMTGWEAMMQYFAPTAAKPIVDVALNRNFMGTPIFKEPYPGETPEPNSQMYFQSVNPILRSMTDTLNAWTGGDEITPGFVDINPEVIEHFIGTWTGGVGKFISNTVTTGMNVADGKNPLSYEDEAVRKTPFARNYTSQIPDYYYQFKFYELTEEVETKKDLFSRYKKSGNREAAKNYRETNKDYLRMSGIASDYKDRIKDMRNRVRALEALGREKEAEKMEEEMTKMYKKYIKMHNAKLEEKTIDWREMLGF